MTSLFDPKIPTGETQEEFDKIIEDFSEYDKNYTATALCKERKELVENMYSKFSPHADRNFLNEIKTNFNSRSWEIYIGYVLSKNTNLLKSPTKGPDFLLEKDGKKIWIEAVAPQRGEVNPTEEKPVLVPGQIYSRSGNIQELMRPKVVRTRGVFEEKYKKFKTYIKSKIVNEEDINIIAINTYDLETIGGESERLGMRTFFGIGDMTITQSGKTGHKFEQQVQKKRESEEISITTEIFLSGCAPEISAVILCSDHIINSPEETGDNLYIFYNWKAKNPLKKNMLPFGTHCFVEGDKIIRKKYSDL